MMRTPAFYGVELLPIWLWEPPLILYVGGPGCFIPGPLKFSFFEPFFRVILCLIATGAPCLGVRLKNLFLGLCLIKIGTRNRTPSSYWIITA